MRHQHPEADIAVGDPLLGHLDRGDIARLAQDGGGAVADLADRRDRDLLADDRARRPGAAPRRGRPRRSSNTTSLRVKRMFRYSGRSSAQGARSTPPSTVSRAAGGSAARAAAASTSSRVGATGWLGVSGRAKRSGAAKPAPSARGRPAARSGRQTLTHAADHPSLPLEARSIAECGAPPMRIRAAAARGERRELRIEPAHVLQEGARPLHQPLRHSRRAGPTAAAISATKWTQLARLRL